MTIPIEDIIKFHKKRTECHVKTLNYFAQLLGYHFPEHDNDKNTEPYQTGYAYHNYAKYNKKCVMLPQQEEAFNFAHKEHHKMQPHHIEHYHSVQDIPEIYLIEMICDWHSANFEQNNITHENEFCTVSEFFNQAMSGFNWSEKQLKLIHNLIEKLANIANYDEVKKIWCDL